MQNIILYLLFYCIDYFIMINDIVHINDVYAYLFIYFCLLPIIFFLIYYIYLYNLCLITLYIIVIILLSFSFIYILFYDYIHYLQYFPL